MVHIQAPSTQAGILVGIVAQPNLPLPGDLEGGAGVPGLCAACGKIAKCLINQGS